VAEKHPLRWRATGANLRRHAERRIPSTITAGEDRKCRINPPRKKQAANHVLMSENSLQLDSGRGVDIFTDPSAPTATITYCKNNLADAICPTLTIPNAE
jgi:hypothetical protein